MPHSTPQPSALKTCTRCKEVKPLSEFTQRKTGKQAGNYEARCKECLRQTSSEYRARHPERVIASRARTEDKYRERRNQQYRERLATDPEFRNKRNNKSRAWRERNRDRIAEYNASRFENQPQMMRDAIKASARKYPERIKARKAVSYAVKSGQFPPASIMVCEHCQEALAAHYHHHKGYEPKHRLDVIALCTECHGKEHQRYE